MKKSGSHCAKCTVVGCAPVIKNGRCGAGANSACGMTVFGCVHYFGQIAASHLHPRRTNWT